MKYKSYPKVVETSAQLDCRGGGSAVNRASGAHMMKEMRIRKQEVGEQEYGGRDRWVWHNRRNESLNVLCIFTISYLMDLGSLPGAQTG